MDDINSDRIKDLRILRHPRTSSEEPRRRHPRHDEHVPLVYTVEEEARFLPTTDDHDIDSQAVHELVPSHPRGNTWGKPIGRIPKGTYNTIDVTMESLNYEESCCKLKREHDEANPPSFTSLKALVLSLVIGALTGWTAFIIMVAIEVLSDFKYQQFRRLLNNASAAPDHLAGVCIAFLAILGFNVSFCLVSAILGVLCPVSCGSGIPHIKAYLNGIQVPFLLRFRTYCHKVVGVIFSVAGGLPVGKEGPMIHAGAIIGGGFSQGLSTTCNCDSHRLKVFRNDASKRDFVAGGASAGVSAAFGAPLGGVLFAIEEGCSHLDVRTIFHALIASSASYCSITVLKSLYIGSDGVMTGGGLLNFGSFPNPSYTLKELIVYAGFGLFGGIAGAGWNALNAKLTQMRMRYLQYRWHKAVEVCLWSLFVTTAAFYSTVFVEDCKDDGVDDYDTITVQLNCPPGRIHAGAAIWFQTPETCVKELFHTHSNFYHSASLLVFTTIYFLLSCVTYGLSISSGLFIPSLLIGAAWGRLGGIGLQHFFPDSNWGDVGKYAFMGAAAQLSGTVRLTISLCVILMEATGALALAFPMLVVVIIAKVAGDLFNHVDESDDFHKGIYDIHLDLTGVPILDWHPPSNASLYTAKDVMAFPVQCLHVRSRLKDVMNILERTSYNAFPIVDPPVDEVDVPQSAQSPFLPRASGRLRGIVLRHDILTMILNNYVDTESHEETWDAYQENYPRRLATHEVWFDFPDDFTCNTYLDFRNIMNPAPQTVSHSHGFNRVFAQFRSTGARHMVVQNDAGEVVGIITRKDLCRPVQTRSWWWKSLSLKAKTIIIEAKGVVGLRVRNYVQLAEGEL